MLLQFSLILSAVTQSVSKVEMSQRTCVWSKALTVQRLKHISLYFGKFYSIMEWNVRWRQWRKFFFLVFVTLQGEMLSPWESLDMVKWFFYSLFERRFILVGKWNFFPPIYFQAFMLLSFGCCYLFKMGSFGSLLVNKKAS